MVNSKTAGLLSENARDVSKFEDESSGARSAFDDINTRAAAYRDVEAGDGPAYWLPEQVRDRMVEGIAVAVRMPGQVGPKSVASAWVQIWRDQGDWNGYELDNPRSPYLIVRTREIRDHADRKFSSEQISRAEEAIEWCAKYLAGDPLAADALQAWAFCKAMDWNIERFLRKRKLAAEALLERRKRDVPDIVTVYRDDARDIAAKITAWANASLAAEKDKAKRQRIRRAAQIRFRREIGAARAVEREVRVTLQDVMPGKVFNRKALKKYGDRAAETIALALIRDGVPVRQPAAR